MSEASTRIRAYDLLGRLHDAVAGRAGAAVSAREIAAAEGYSPSEAAEAFALLVAAGLVTRTAEHSFALSERGAEEVRAVRARHKG